MVYQEQVQQAANVLAGFSLGEGDILRRAMGKKKPEVMAKQRDKFVEGCAQDQPDPGAAGRRRSSTTSSKFAGYGFNKSHSAALRHHRLPDRLPEGQLPRRVHGRPALERNRQHRQAARARRRGAGDGHRGPAARRQRQRGALQARRRRPSASAWPASRTSATARSRPSCASARRAARSRAWWISARASTPSS